jgi:Flp pilus assembly protein TadG
VTVRLNCPLPIRLVTALSGLCHDDRATQIAEFAISLPLLVVFVVGIFDFSGALTLKQKLTNAARDAARVAAADPSNDLAGPPTSSVPVSVSDAFQVVDNYLLSEKINDCGLGSALPVQSGTSLTWISTAASCPNVAPFSGIILTINRGFVTAQSIGGNSTDVVNTQVTIQYAYKWRFNSIITLLVPSASYASVSYITTTATAYNEN